MQNVRCSQCRKLLAKAIYQQLQIKCPRCGRINERTTSPRDKEIRSHGETSRAVDRR
ncbi:MAG: Com family DNA-binding transcriptional regulator [Neptuniibacter sp.]